MRRWKLSALALGVFWAFSWADAPVPMPHNVVQQRVKAVTWLEWDTVEGAVGYRLYRQVQIHYDVDEERQIVPRDEFQTASVPWSYIEALEGVARMWTQVASIDNDSAPWGISSEMLIDGERVKSAISWAAVADKVPTAVVLQSWGQVKQGHPTKPIEDESTRPLR